MMNVICTKNSNAIAALVVRAEESFPAMPVKQMPKFSFNLLERLRQRLDKIEIHDPEMARFLVRLIPAQCPFERDLKLFGHKVGHIPPLCKLNPFYEQLVSLRFRALCFLAERCGEDIRCYC
jgi:hypothetical protein